MMSYLCELIAEDNVPYGIEDRLNSLAAFSQTFNFFGTTCKVLTQPGKDPEILRFHYKDYFAESTSEQPDLTLWFLCEGPNVGMLESIYKKDGLQKLIYIKIKGKEVELYNDFRDWSGKTTPFPPFNFEPLKSRFFYFQGSSIALTQENKGITFWGRPYSGKSTLTNWCLKYNPAALALSDDITIIDRSSFQMLGFCTPTAIREESKSWFNDEREHIANHHTISEVTGRVEYFRFDEVYGNRVTASSCLTTVFVLNNKRNTNRPDFELTLIDNELKLEFINMYLLPFNDILSELPPQFLNIKMYLLTYDINAVDKASLIKSVLNI